jgi:hypothetical protein
MLCVSLRVQDVAELARLKILGSKLKKSATRKEPPSVVLQAMQQQRQVAEGTTGGGVASLAAPLDGSGHTPGTVVLSPSTAGAAGNYGWATVSSMQDVCVKLGTASACLAFSVATVLARGKTPPCVSAALDVPPDPSLVALPSSRGPCAGLGTPVGLILLLISMGCGSNTPPTPHSQNVSADSFTHPTNPFNSTQPHHCCACCCRFDAPSAPPFVTPDKPQGGFCRPRRAL